MNNGVIINYENLFKRLLMLNQLGIYLHGADGHIWIENDPEREYPLVLNRVVVNNKIYGGVIQALDVMDAALKADDKSDLLELWNDYGNEVLFLGLGGVDESRIDIVSDGKGGLY